jgi:hypothetical protein
VPRKDTTHDVAVNEMAIQSISAVSVLIDFICYGFRDLSLVDFFTEINSLRLIQCGSGSQDHE